MHCKYCGTKTKNAETHCSSCGAPASSFIVEAEIKKNTTPSISNDVIDFSRQNANKVHQITRLIHMPNPKYTAGEICTIVFLIMMLWGAFLSNI